MRERRPAGIQDPLLPLADDLDPREHVEFEIVAGGYALPEEGCERQEAGNGDRQITRDGMVQQGGGAILVHSKLFSEN